MICWLVCVLFIFNVLIHLTMSSASIDFRNVYIVNTWNNYSIPEHQYVWIRLQYTSGCDLNIMVYSPFYNDPVLPDWSKNPDRFDKLYNYETVELFLLNSKDEHYLEIEMSPRGQFLLLELKGYRNVIRNDIKLKDYKVTINNKHWFATAIVDKKDLPNGIDKFNAYSIFGTEPYRNYLALFPAPKNNIHYSKPDFHRLELFQPISLFK